MVLSKLRSLLMFLINLAIICVLYFFGYLHFYFAITTTLAILSIFILSSSKEKNIYKVITFLLLFTLPLSAFMYAFETKEHLGSTKIKREWANILYRNRKTNISSMDTLQSLKAINNSVYKSSSYMVDSLGMPIYPRANFKYINSGKSYFENLYADCKKAHKYILIEAHKIIPGENWEKLFEILRLKSREGVEIKLIYDKDSCTKYIKTIDFLKMCNHGIHTIPFGRPIGLSSTSHNCKNYKRLFIIDGKVGYMGGFDISDNYNGYEEGDISLATKDVAVRLEGQPVRTLIVAFFEDYQFVTRQVVKLDNYFIEETRTNAKNWILPYSTNPVSADHNNKNIVLSLIYNARESISIFTTHLTLDDELKNALILSAKSGVNVKILFSGGNENKRVINLSKSYFSELIREGVEVHEYNSGRMTTKMIVVDGDSALISSNNLDFVSIYRDFNAGVYLYGEGVKEIVKDVSVIMANCPAITLKDIQKRKFRDKLSATWFKFITLFK